jgi:hypothetical protein
MEHLGKPLDLGRACARLCRQARRKLQTVTLAVHRCLGVKIFIYAAVSKEKKHVLREVMCLVAFCPSEPLMPLSFDGCWVPAAIPFSMLAVMIRAGHSRCHGD